MGKGSVAGVLGNPVGTKGYIENVYPGISSHDEVVSSGIYTISDSVSVSPKNGVLVVNASSAVVFQTFYGQNGNNQSRLRWYGNWSPWQRIDNFGYNSLQELSAGVADSLKLNSFTSNGVLGTSQTDWVQIAKDVVASVKDNGTFSVIHNHKGQRYVYGYIYADKLYGTVNIQMYEGYTKTVDIDNGVYTLRE